MREFNDRKSQNGTESHYTDMFDHVLNVDAHWLRLI